MNYPDDSNTVLILLRNVERLPEIPLSNRFVLRGSAGSNIKV